MTTHPSGTDDPRPGTDDSRREPDDAAGPDAPADADEAVETAHLDGLDEGSGCTEIWAHLSAQRDE